MNVTRHFGRPGHSQTIRYVVEHPDGPLSGAPLDHLERCPRCRREVEQTMAIVFALRRSVPRLEGAEPPADLWPRLRARVTKPAIDAWRGRMTIASVVLSAGLVVAFVGPHSAWPDTGRRFQELGVNPLALAATTRAEEEADSRWLFKSAKAVRKEVDTDQPISYQPFDWRRYGEAKPASADPSTGRPIQVR